MHKLNAALLGAAVVLGAATLLPAEDPRNVNLPLDVKPAQPMVLAKPVDLISRQEQFAQQHPGIGIGSWEGQSSIYGKAFSHGLTAAASAEAFRANGLPLLGIDPEQVQPYANFLPADHAGPAGPNTVPVMYNRNTGQFKFTAHYYTQEIGGLEVYGSRLTLLTRNEPNHPLVLANVNLRDLPNFHVDQTAIGRHSPQAALAMARSVLGNDMMVLTQPTLQVWAGLNDMVEQPRVAYVFNAEGGDHLLGTYQAFQFVADAATGTILHRESLIHHVDVTGNVSANASTGHGADICNGMAVMPLPYARVNIGATVAYADASGNFTIPNAGSSDVTVTAELRSERFRVVNTTTPGGGNSILNQTVTPPGPANFLFNNPNDPNPSGQYKRAEVNAYIHAHKVRDLVIEHNPAFPSISTELNFPVNVNINQTCNAFYSSANQSINFYVSGGTNNCTNTANGTVVHHEYGHRIVNAAGSGQGAYGEGFGDVMGVLVTDQPCLGQGFSPNSETTPCSGGPASCSGCLRYANNTSQYQTTGCSSCGSAIHACGRLISGCVWSTRNYLQASHPATYLDTLRNLTINSVLLHSGTTITPQITIDFLTLDDDDSDLSNGTPHYWEINNGFSDHNMPGPPLNGFTITATPEAQASCSPASVQYTINLAPVATSGQVTLSATGVPAGASVNFNPNPVTMPGSSIMTVNPGAASTGLYDIQIVGTQNNFVHATTVEFGVSAAPPATPTLTSPPNGAVGVPLSPTLTWDSANGLFYTVQIASDPGFSNIVHTANVSSNTYVAAAGLNTVTTYYWRVSASNGCGSTGFSSVFSFQTTDLSILLVDDDDNSPNVRAHYTAALDAMSLSYDIWDTANSTMPEPTFAQMQPYNMIIWFSGDAFSTAIIKAGPKPETETALAQWLQGGGCLFLSAQDYLYDRLGGTTNSTPNTFMHTYLGIAAPVDHDEGITNVTGANVYAGFGPFALTYSAASGGPGLSNFSDRVEPRPGAQRGFTYVEVGSTFGTVLTFEGQGFKTSFWGFPWETIPNAAQRQAALSTFISWCAPPAPCVGDVTGDDQVNVNDLLVVINAWGACPAPCPADCSPAGGDGQVNVNDLLAVINAWGTCP